MIKHTKGPWTAFQVCGQIIVTERREFESTDGVELLVIIEKGSDMDASLIAAAPEMLEALSDMVSSIRAIDSKHPDLDIPGFLSREIEFCEAVIKKAKGIE